MCSSSSLAGSWVRFMSSEVLSTSWMRLAEALALEYMTKMRVIESIALRMMVK